MIAWAGAPIALAQAESTDLLAVRERAVADHYRRVAEAVSASGRAFDVEVQGFTHLSKEQLGSWAWGELVSPPGERALRFSRSWRQGQEGVVLDAVVPAWYPTQLPASEALQEIYRAPADTFLARSESVLASLENLLAVTGYQVTLRFDGEVAGYRASFVWLPPEPTAGAGSVDEEALRYLVVDNVALDTARVVASTASLHLDQTARDLIHFLASTRAARRDAMTAPPPLAAAPGARCVEESGKGPYGPFRNMFTSELHEPGGFHGPEGQWRPAYSCTRDCVGRVDPETVYSRCTEHGELTNPFSVHRFSSDEWLEPEVGDGPGTLVSARAGIACSWTHCDLYVICQPNTITIVGTGDILGFALSAPASPTGTGGRVAQDIVYARPCRLGYGVTVDALGIPEGESLALTLTAGEFVDELTLGDGTGPAEFTTLLPSGQGFRVAVTSAPEDYECTVLNGTGTINDADVTNVQVICVDRSECLYCNFPDLQDRCAIAPETCGNPATPGGGGIFCNWSATLTLSQITTSVMVWDPQDLTLTETLTVIGTVEVSSFAISCRDLRLADQSTSTAWSGEGPTLYSRVRYDPQGLTGVVPVRGIARDDLHGIDRIHLWIDGHPAQLQDFQIRQPDPYTCSELPSAGCDANSLFSGLLDTTTLTDGLHTLTFVAINGRSPNPIPGYLEIPIWVDHDLAGCGDTQAPNATVTSPPAAAVLAGTVPIGALAGDNVGVTAVDFYVDGAFRHQDASAPFGWSWDTTGEAGGPHTLRALALDACGNRGFSAEVPVTVDNASAGPVTRSFAPTADAWVNQSSPSESYGPYNFLRVRTSANGSGRHSYLKLAVTGVDGAVQSATLRVLSQDREIEDLGVWLVPDTSWSESAIHWDNAPIAGAQLVRVVPSVPPYTWAEIDLTGWILPQDATYTIVLASNTDLGKLDFWSRESAYPPALEVTYLP